MSWNAYLDTPDGIHVGDWNYTHNTNGMIAAALKAAGHGDTEQCGGPLGPAIGPAWWKRLSGMSGRDSVAFLDAIITELTDHPDVYAPMNGWGTRESLIGVLTEMRDAVPPVTETVWTTSG